MTRHPHRRLRTHPIIALLIAAMVPVTAGLIMAPPYGSWDWLATLPIALVVYLCTIAAVMMLGLPSFALLHKLGWVRWWSILILGLLCGGVIGATVWKPYDQMTIDVPIMALTGAATGLLFWWLLDERYLLPSGDSAQDAG